MNDRAMPIDADPADGLAIVDGEPPGEDEDPEDSEAGAADSAADSGVDRELESLRDEFVDAFNARDLEAVLALVAEDVETPDIPGDGADALTEELETIWERSPAALLTRAFCGDRPCAIAWLPDEDGCWTRASLIFLDAEDGVITVVEMGDDADALAQANAEAPDGDELEEGATWTEWDSGEDPALSKRR